MDEDSNRLLKYSIDKSKTISETIMTFLQSCCNNNIDIVKYILNKNLINDVSAITAGLDHSCKNNNYDIGKYIFEYICSSNIEFDMHSVYDIVFVSGCYFGNIDILNYIIDYCYKINNKYNIHVFYNTELKSSLTYEIVIKYLVRLHKQLYRNSERYFDCDIIYNSIIRKNIKYICVYSEYIIHNNILTSTCLKYNMLSCINYVLLCKL